MREGWTSTALKDVCAIDKAKHNGESLPYVGLEHIESGTGKFIGSLEPASVKSATFRFTPSHVLYGRLRPYLNKVLLPDFDGHCSSEIFPLRVKSDLDRQFLYYWLSWKPVVKEIDKTSTGARMPRANVSKLLEFELPLPPLPEQKRIVAMLDEAFAGIATAVANTEKNLANARELFESYLNAAFSQRGKEWVHWPLVKTCQVFTDGDWIETKDQSDNGIRLIQTGNVGVGEFKNRANKARFISDETFFRLKCQEVYSRDCLVSRLPDPVGRSCIIPELENRMITAVDCTIIRFDESMVIPEFFNYFSQSSKYIARVEEYCTGATRKRISRRNLGKVEVPTPPVTEQKEFVAKFDELAVEQRRLQSIYQQKLNALSELKLSLLQKAFSGQLTTAPQDEIETALA